MEGELLLALDGKLKDKSTRQIAIDLFGADSIRAVWHDGCAERSATRRRVRESLHLMNGGYRDLVIGRARPRRRDRRSRDASGPGRGGSSRSRTADEAGLFGGAGSGAGRQGTSAPRPRYLDTGRAAAYLGIGASLLNRLRAAGGGPRYTRVRRRVIYDRRDLDTWMERRKTT